MRQNQCGRSSYEKAVELEDRLIAFGDACSAVLRGRYRDPVTSHIAKQLVRSASAPAANYAEARGAESRRDFIHKLGVCLKELRESHVWLRRAARCARPHESIGRLVKECDELISIFVVSIKTARTNEERRRRTESCEP